MKTCFILNPHSGRGGKEARLAITRKYFQAKFGKFDLVITKNRDDITQQTRIALNEGFEQIVVLGGDGTVNAAVNGFFEDGRPIQTDARLVISKWGTGSDYFKTVTEDSYVSDWKSLVTEHHVREVDLGEIDFGGSKKLFINIASCGLSARVAEMKNRGSQWMPGTLSYLIPAIRSLVSHASSLVRINLDGRIIETKAMALFVAKGIYAGGGMKLGGGVSVDDGMFDVKLFEHMNFLKGLKRIPRLYQGRFDGIAEIRAFKAKEIKIHSGESIPVECDGEVYGHTDVVMRVKPKAIKVCWPRE